MKNDHQVFFNSIERSLNVKRTSILEKMKSLPKFWEEEYLNASCTESEETYVDKHHYCSSTSFKLNVKLIIYYLNKKVYCVIKITNLNIFTIYTIFIIYTCEHFCNLTINRLLNNRNKKTLEETNIDTLFNEKKLNCWHQCRIFTDTCCCYFEEYRIE